TTATTAATATPGMVVLVILRTLGLGFGRSGLLGRGRLLLDSAGVLRRLGGRGGSATAGAAAARTGVLVAVVTGRGHLGLQEQRRRDDRLRHGARFRDLEQRGALRGGEQSGRSAHGRDPNGFRLAGVGGLRRFCHDGESVLLG